MLSQLFILFALVSAVLSAKNLREEPAAAAVPVDHKRAQSALQTFFKESSAVQASDASLIQERIGASVAKAKKMAASGTKETKGESAPFHPMTDGYYITRHRPNADCSGVPSRLNARRINNHCERWTDSEGSYIFGCNHADAQGIVREVVAYFFTPDCSGEPYVIYGQNSDVSKCSINLQNHQYWSPPDMVSVQCAPNGLDTVSREGGFVTTRHVKSAVPEEDDNTCSRPPLQFSAHKMNTCELQVDSVDYQNEVAETTTFAYVSMLGSNAMGDITMTGFADAGCTRPMWTGKVNVAQMTNDFNGCVDHGDYYSRTTFHPVPGQHH